MRRVLEATPRAAGLAMIAAAGTRRGRHRRPPQRRQIHPLQSAGRDGVAPSCTTCRGSRATASSGPRKLDDELRDRPHRHRRPGARARGSARSRRAGAARDRRERRAPARGRRHGPGRCPATRRCWPRCAAATSRSCWWSTRPTCARLAREWGSSTGSGSSRLLVSAEHGTGIEELRDARARALIPARSRLGAKRRVRPSPSSAAPTSASRRCSTASSAPSACWSRPQPGTTRDPVDTVVEWDGKPFVLVDTAGIRRRAKVSGAPEDLAVMMAQRQIERGAGGAAADRRRAGRHLGRPRDRGRHPGAGRARASWSATSGTCSDDEARHRLERGVAAAGRAARRAAARERVGGDRARRGQLFPQVRTALADFHRQLETSRAQRRARARDGAHQPPSKEGKPWKVFYGTQVGTAPPTFMLFANRTLPRHASAATSRTGCARAGARRVSRSGW